MIEEIRAQLRAIKVASDVPHSKRDDVVFLRAALLASNMYAEQALNLLKEVR